jgi:hypothetical protein
MKTIAFMPLHYGKPYLAAAIRSLLYAVDEFHILYAERPSHNGNQQTAVPCPDNPRELYAIARQAAGDKLRWVQGDWRLEGEHRDAIYTFAPDADIILSVDSDEVWNPALAQLAFQNYDVAMREGRRHWLVPFVHFWRSFNRAIVNDGQMPQRITYPKASNEFYQRIGQSYIPRGETGEKRHICHFGYAVPVEYQRYKWAGGHGHQSELRPDFMSKYEHNEVVDVHPVSKRFWNPEPVDPRDYLPDWMQDHPYWGKDVIE